MPIGRPAAIILRMAGSKRTHHVALVRDETVLVAADGSLPGFVQSKTRTSRPS